MRSTVCWVASRRCWACRIRARCSHCRGGRAGLFAEAADQGPRADAGVGRDVAEGEVGGQVVLEPGEQRFERAALRGGSVVVEDELRLSALPFQGHDGQPGRVGGDGRAVVRADHVQAQVQSGRRTGRGEDPAVVDVQDAGVDLDVRIGGGQEVGRDPVGGGPQPVQKARGGQRERARADRGDACAVPGGRPQRVTYGGGERCRRVGRAGHDDRVRAREPFQAPGCAQREGARVRLLLLGADADLVAGTAVRQPGAGEDLDRGGQVERDHLVQRENGDGVHGAKLPLHRITARTPVCGSARTDCPHPLALSR